MSYLYGLMDFKALYTLDHSLLIAMLEACVC